MIYVSQGHEKSIGIEIFIKSFILLNKKQANLFNFVCFKESIIETLDSLKIKYEIKDSVLSFSNSNLNCTFLGATDETQSTISLNKAINLTEENTSKNILLTLPTSKDQLINKGKVLAGHTEYFRNLYKNKNISMIFKSPDCNLIVLTDHIPLVDVSAESISGLLTKKIELSLKGYTKFFNDINEIIITGINPHAGENGIIGNEEISLAKEIQIIKEKHKEINILGPIPADTALFLKNDKVNQLFVFIYHDQALTWFKRKYGLIGLNITLGLPYLRMSVDHGTAFDLYQKDSAIYNGCLYMLKSACGFYNDLSA